MQAATIDRYGPADALILAEVPTPVPGPGEILVRVHAAPVTTADWRLRAAVYPKGLRLIGRMVSGLMKPRHRIPGVDFAGTVTAVGAGVTRYAPGDRVFGFNGHGTHAEYVTVKAEGGVAHIPDALSFTEAAALPFGGDTAMCFLERFAGLKPGERLLVAGAAGNVGHLAVQVGKALGAEVTAMARPDAHPMLRALGADHVVDYTRRDVARMGERWDVLFDPIHVLPYRRMRRAMAKGGRLLVVEGGVREMLQSLWPWRRGGRRVVFNVAMASHESLTRLAAMAAAGQIRPVIGARLPLDRIADAHRIVETRRQRGITMLEIVPDAAEHSSPAAA